MISKISKYTLSFAVHVSRWFCADTSSWTLSQYIRTNSAHRDRFGWQFVASHICTPSWSRPFLSSESPTYGEHRSNAHMVQIRGSTLALTLRNSPRDANNLQFFSQYPSLFCGTQWAFAHHLTLRIAKRIRDSIAISYVMAIFRAKRFDAVLDVIYTRCGRLFVDAITAVWNKSESSWASPFTISSSLSSKSACSASSSSSQTRSSFGCVPTSSRFWTPVADSPPGHSDDVSWWIHHAINDYSISYLRFSSRSSQTKPFTLTRKANLGENLTQFRYGCNTLDTHTHSQIC